MFSASGRKPAGMAVCRVDDRVPRVDASADGAPALEVITRNAQPDDEAMMRPQPATGHNVRQAVPLFGVREMAASLRFYVDGLGFRMTHHWIDEGTLRWCWLELGGAAVMLQEYRPDRVPHSPA